MIPSWLSHGRTKGVMTMRHLNKLYIALLALGLLSILCIPAFAVTEFRQVDLTRIDDPGRQMAEIARNQEGLNLYDRYHEDWCADFVCECAQFIGQTAAIPHYASTSKLHDEVLKCGGQVVTTPQAGDIVFYFGYENGKVHNHTALMIDSTYCASGNDNNQVLIKNYLSVCASLDSLRIVLVRPAYRPQKPTGWLDGVEGGYGSVRVYGWAKDKDTPEQPVPLHIYIGGEAGSGADMFAAATTISRNDLRDSTRTDFDGIYGFDMTLYTDRHGEQPVYVYALDTSGGENQLLGSATVYIGWNQSPIGELESAVGGVGTVRVTGSVRDPDTPDTPVDIHLYVGGPVGSGAPFYVIRAREQNEDGVFLFDEVVPVSPSGNQRVYFYMINTVAGYNPFMGTADVYIEPDTTDPVIDNVRVSDIDSSGYTVTCDVSDDIAIDKVVFPAWTIEGEESIPDDQDDLLDQWWDTALGQIENGHVTYRVNTSEHDYETGRYMTHIYAYDVAGNSFGVSDLDFPALKVDVPLPIQNVRVCDVTSKGYTVSCDLDPSWGNVTKVCFPTWSEPDGQDDMLDNWGETAIGTMEDGHVVYRVETSDHGGQKGCAYLTHIYAWYADGHFSGVSDEQYDCLRIWVPDADYDFTLPAGIRRIEDSAFEGICAAMVYIPDGCESIGPNAFGNCEALVQVRIPASVTCIDDTAFSGCQGVLVVGSCQEARRIAALNGFAFQEEG